MNKFLAKMKNEEGQALAEYGLLVALIAVICVAAVTAIGTSVSTKLLSIATSIYAGRSNGHCRATFLRGEGLQGFTKCDWVGSGRPSPTQIGKME